MRKKDEMEQKMTNEAAKLTWIVTVMALFIIGGIKYFMNDMEMNIFLVIANLSTILLILLEKYYLSKANEDNTFKKIILATVVIIVILLGIVWFVS